jgi:uncharacterized protein
MLNKVQHPFFHDGSRLVQDLMDSRSVADRLYESRRKGVITEDEKAVIEASTMFFLATADDNGRPDCSVKGGHPGFVQVIEDNALVFPDYDGNGMYRSLGNISVNPYVGLLFLELAGDGRTLRVNGVASVARASPSVFSRQGAKLLVRVTALDVFSNGARYLPKSMWWT